MACGTMFGNNAGMSVGTNIRALRKHLGYTIEQLALKADVDTSNLSKLERDIGGYSKESLERLAGALNVRIGTLFGELPEDQLALAKTTRVPVLDEEQIRAYFSGSLDSSHFSQVEHILMDSRETGRVFAFRIPDQSTAPEFRVGEMVLVNIDMKPRPGMFVAVDRPGEGIAIREYRIKGYDAKKRPILEYAAINPAYPSFSTANETITLIGVVFEHRRRLS